MKKILLSSSLVTAAMAIGFIFVPDRASAHTNAREKFASMRNALAKAFSDGELTISGSQSGDSATFSVLLDGQPLPPDIPIHVTGERHAGYSDYTVQIDFSDSTFKTITFGTDHNTLKLVPKAALDTYDLVHLDPKTGKPLSWSTYKDGSPKAVTTVSYKDQQFNATGEIPPKGKTSTNTSDSVITAHIRFVTR